ATTGIATTIVVAKLFGLDKGAAGGLMAGALTQSPALGTTTDAVTRLGLPPEAASALADSAAIAYAVSYLFGEFGMLMFVRNLAPYLLRVNLKDEAAALERKQHGGPGGSGGGQLVAYQPIAARAYRVTIADGSTAGDLEARLGDRSYVARLHRDGVVRRP